MRFLAVSPAFIHMPGVAYQNVAQMHINSLKIKEDVDLARELIKWCTSRNVLIGIKTENKTKTTYVAETNTTTIMFLLRPRANGMCGNQILNY